MHHPLGKRNKETSIQSNNDEAPAPTLMVELSIATRRV